MPPRKSTSPAATATAGHQSSTARPAPSEALLGATATSRRMKSRPPTSRPPVSSSSLTRCCAKVSKDSWSMSATAQQPHPGLQEGRYLRHRVVLRPSRSAGAVWDLNWRTPTRLICSTSTANNLPHPAPQRQPGRRWLRSLRPRPAPQLQHQRRFKGNIYTGKSTTESACRNSNRPTARSKDPPPAIKRQQAPSADGWLS